MAIIVKKIWIQQAKVFLGGGYREWPMEGWYLFGFIPLYVRDTGPRERRGKSSD